MSIRALGASSAALAVALSISFAAYVPSAAASSDFSTGRIGKKNRGPGSSHGLGFCRLYLGPRGEEIPDGAFVLRIGDLDYTDGDELQVTGAVVEEAGGALVLVADRADARDFFESVVQKDFHQPGSALDLDDLEVLVEKTAQDLGPDDVTCRVEIRGTVVGGSAPAHLRAGLGETRVARAMPVARLRYGGNGLAIPGVEAEPEGAALEADVAAAASMADAPASASCPVPTLAPVPAQCATPKCLVNFAGLQWWTSYEFFPGSGFYNMNNAWSPKNVTVDGEGLHLFVRQQDVGGGMQWTAAEAVAMFNADGSQVDHGYGTYLVSARIKTAPSFPEMDPNVAFGVFTYERDRTGPSVNPGRELDLAEVSRWGNPSGSCTSSDKRLCQGNSQFTVQEYNRQANNLHRYTIPGSPNEITLVMEWPGAGMPVTFKEYNGTHTLQNLPADPSYQWTTASGGSDDQNQFIPASHCQRFHLNFWMGAFQNARNGYNPPPSAVQEIVVTNFEYQPQS